MSLVNWAGTGVPPSMANMFRLHAKTEKMMRPITVEMPGASQMLQDIARIQDVFRQSVSGIEQSMRATQALIEDDVRGAFLRQHEEMKMALAQVNPVLPVVDEMQKQMRDAQAHVRNVLAAAAIPDLQVTQELARTALQAAARLSALDKQRVNDALVHWQGLSANARRDQLALAQAVIERWRAQGSTDLQSFAAIVGKALDRRVLLPVAKSLWRSSVLVVLSVPLTARRPRTVARCVGALQSLKWSISRHAPPVCLA